MEDCTFCNIYRNNKEKIVAENEFAFAVYDLCPVSEGHMLIIPKRHFDSFFDATNEEITYIYDLLKNCKKILQQKYSPTGYNVGINIGFDAGQTIMHFHTHLIPRYKGDVEDPRGGIRKLKPLFLTMRDKGKHFENIKG